MGRNWPISRLIIFFEGSYRVAERDYEILYRPQLTEIKAYLP